MARGKRLGEILRERGQISAPDLKKVLRDQQGKFAHLGEILLERKLVSRTDLATAVSEVSGVEYFDCQDPEPSSEVLELIPANLARRCMAVPVKVGDKTLTVVMARPQNLQLIDELQFKSGLKIVTWFGFQNEVQTALDRLYGLSATVSDRQSADVTTGMEFISSSSQQRNIEAMRYAAGAATKIENYAGSAPGGRHDQGCGFEVGK